MQRNKIFRSVFLWKGHVSLNDTKCFTSKHILCFRNYTVGITILYCLNLWFAHIIRTWFISNSCTVSHKKTGQGQKIASMWSILLLINKWIYAQLFIIEQWLSADRILAFRLLCIITPLRHIPRCIMNM